MLFLRFHRGEELPTLLAGDFVVLVFRPDVPEQACSRYIAAPTHMADVAQKVRDGVSIEMEQRGKTLIADCAVECVLLQIVRHHSNFRFRVYLLVVNFS